MPAAAALVFDPAIALPGPPPDLSRAGREPRAFLGYDEGVTETFYLRTDDRQREGGRSGSHFFGSGDRFERRAVTVKTGVRYR